ncbi:MAG: hypothetical protein ACT4PW_07005 [Acidimicrobiia bacterium]
MAGRYERSGTLRSCNRCGAGTEGSDDTLAAGWSSSADEAGTTWLCGGCTRENLRAIEAKLPEEWWA